MTLASKALGDKGEQIACAYLEEKGYKILDVNFRFPPKIKHIKNAFDLSPRVN